ncbi:LOW QUALITY PROTEIN: uncharacterized protein LOC117572062 [Drosophila albomicans]|uniref:LOW QUALITY PROTEIN: uncharacterized protein LOC117572062 n=1 Tax=Drosophila albomicans TaxID=7291 RepID=A0A6P8X2Y8_DROAB|nr:LOW QUALITY PROTEIN: uncharacterized protein LOC117572062 [Drosophila albomicans]
MSPELPPIVLAGKDLNKYRKLNRLYPVSREFLHRNWGNAKRFICYALQPRCVLRNYAWRKRGNRVVIVRRPRILLFDPRLKSMIKRRKANVKQWSPSIVRLYKKMGFVTEYEETELYGEELSKQMKQQLELLKNGKRGISLIEDANKNVELRLDKEYPTVAQPEEDKKAKELLTETIEKDTADNAAETDATETKERQDVNLIGDKPVTSELMEIEECESQANSESVNATEKSGGSKFLDMLMSKVRVKNFAKESNIPTTTTSTNESTTCNKVIAEESSDCNFHDDASDDFVGFDESDHQPGMLLTPLVPQSCKTVDGNAAFVSDALEAYMKKNNLRESSLEDRERLLEPMYQDGRVTAHSVPPHMDMPAVPDSLQRLRTVADRRLYLQRCKSQKMAIINNEANVYRELQRKSRQRKVKVAAMQTLQSSGSQMPFTRQGWQAASYVATDMDKYYYQVIRIDGEMVRLPGSRGNNSQREKRPHRSQLTAEEIASIRCNRSKCVDATLSSELKVLPTWPMKGGKLQKLNQYPLPAIFKPCPLSQKPYQKPLDDDTAALLLSGGSMAIVSMPPVHLDVKPELGRPLDEIAKRYLQYILPHHDITREWAEFSVSTLQMQAQDEEANAEGLPADGLPAGRRRSFTFVIPYLNDRNHILVRRVVDRSEQLDDSFTAEQPPEKLQEFQFRKELPESPDPIDLACADMISDMINTVAISCSENSFVSIDPDASYSSTSEISPIKEETAASKVDKSGNKLSTGKQQQQQLRRPNKQQRLAKELRRLNATIIDAAAMAKDANKPCVKEHCQMGCLCESLAGEFPAREHCGRADCVLECRCTRAELTRVMRVETDGRGLSNEDAFNLRRKATARLAKMEKDFTSTLVLTDNETLLINETQCDKKRRCTKAPKRYEDFDDSVEDDDLVRPAKAAKRDPSVKRSRVTPETAFATLPSLQPKCTVKDTDFVQLKHCEVSLRRLPDIANLAIFCMTHQLYNCFCGGTALEGKPVIIEKEDGDAVAPHYVPELATRAHYSFERPPEESQAQSKKRRKDNKAQLQDLPKKPTIKPFVKILPKQEQLAPTIKPEIKLTIKTPIPPTTSAQSSLPPPPTPLATTKAAASGVVSPERPAELDIIFSYYRSRPFLCRRAVSVPKNCYLRLNRRRAERVSLEVRRSETPQTQELLRKRISNAVHYYRAELDQQRRIEQEQQKQQHKLTESEPQVILVRDDSDESEAGNVVASKRATHSELGVEMQPPKRKRQLPNSAEESKDAIKQKTDVQQSAPMPEIQMPKISSCFSLYTGATDSTASSSSPSLDDSASVDSAVFRASYNDVILKMNTHVSKKMQDIDLALQRESKIIPAPNEDILCIIKWTNFLAAFESDYVFIWDVQMKNYNFLAATITNMMPAVCGAIGVVNTRFAPDPSALPLMARMLLESKQNENTGRLAVVMQGRQQYWLVKGFLRYMEGNACTKPTPQSHPILTKKINVLCSLMVKQKIREQHKQLELARAAKEAANLQSLSATTSSQDIATVSTPSSVASPAAVPATMLPTPPARSTTTTTQNKDAGLIIRSNIEFRKVHQGDVSALQIPERHAKDHRWLVLNLFDDFSHIFVPAFRDMISLDRIYQVVRASYDTQKVIKLQFFKDAPYDAFVTPASKRKIYFGPLPLDKEPPVLVLLQSVDGKMMLREVYQREHSIKVQAERRTMAFWVLQINNQVHFEVDLTASAGMVTKVEKTESEQQLQQQQLQQLNAKDDDNAADDDDDDDCMIIDDDVDAAKQPESSQETKPQRTNYTIQTMSAGNSGVLQIVRSPTNAAGGNSTSNGSVAGGFLPFIANVPAIGRTAPSTQFLTPQVQVTQTPVVPSTSGRSETNTEPKPAKISRISVQRCKTPALATTAASVNSKETGSPPAKINESLQQLLSGGNGNIKIGVPSTGITITKMKSTDANGTSAHPLHNNAAVEPIKIGLKRKATGPSPGASIIRPAIAESSIRTPTIVKKTATTISIGNLPIHQVRPLPTKLQQLAAARNSLPHKQPAAAAKDARSSLPAKHPVTEASSTTSTPEAGNRKVPATASTSKPQYGFLVAKDLPRYRVKFMDSKYMVKIPDRGVYAFRNCAAASDYLNRELTRKENLKPFLPGEWKFLPFENCVQKSTTPQKQQSPPQQQTQQRSAAKSLSQSTTMPIVIED